jgi:hypothetical protein
MTIVAINVRCVWLGLVLCGCGAVQAASPDSVVVDNSQVRLVFGTRPVPFLSELVHKPSGQNLIAQPASQSLFSLEVPAAKGGTTSFESQRAKEGSIRVRTDAGGQHIELQFSGLGPGGNLRVRIGGRLDGEEPLVRWTLAVDNPGRQALAAVRFPYVTAVPAIGSPGDDVIVAPAFPGALIENPAQNWPASYRAGWAFPGQQSAQFFAFQDRTAGIYMASMDTGGNGRALRVAKQDNKRFVLFQEYQLPEQPAAVWESPYAVVLGVTAGTWQHTADLYKRWAVRQPWCACPLAQRRDIPDWWKRGPCIHTCSVRTQDADGRCNGSYYPKLLEHLRALRAKIDGPVLPMLAGWENHRTWTAGDYFPVFDAAHAEGAIATLRQDGFRPFVFLSGLYYTFRNEGPDGSDVPGGERYTASFAIDRETGKPATAVLGGHRKDGWRRQSYSFCPAAPGTKEFFRATLDQLHALGIDVVQMDQATTGAGAACYSTAHGHQPGPGTYQAVAFRELLADMRRHGRALSPDFVLFNEELHEELIPYLDGFHTRESRERYWYRRTPGARGIPLFTYLYHEYALAYGGEGPSALKFNSPAIVREHAVNLVTGKTPAISVWSRQEAMAETHPDQIHMLRNHARLLKTEAQRFLMLGRMLHPLEFDTPWVTLRISAEHAGGWRGEPFEERAVLTSSWQSPEGLVGHCLVNITDVKQVVNLALDTRGAASWAQAQVDLYRADQPDTCQHVAKATNLPCNYHLELTPLEAVFFVLRPRE